jgi:homoserine O-acetyltransferase
MEQVYTGKGRTLDPDRYFIIIVNQIGNGLSTSPHNTPPPSGMAKFPRVRIGDDVRAQHKLIVEKWGIRELALVTGGSMGAQQTWEWAVRYPEMVKRAAPIAGTAKTTNALAMLGPPMDESITSDPGWNNGSYKTNLDVQVGLRRHAGIWAVMGWCAELLNEEKWRDLGFSSLTDFQTNFMEGYFVPMDPNDLLNNSWKWQNADVSRVTRGDLAAALGRIKAKVFVMPISSDLIFPWRDCQTEQKMTPNSEFRIINSCAGHLGLFGVEGEQYTRQVDRHLADLLSRPD